MKVWISYFNNIRHMTKYCIPLSTAMWDPKWYTQHIDKNGIVNGLRCEPLVLPLEKWKLLSENQCQKNCPFEHEKCEFEKIYYNHLKTLNFKALMNWFKAVCEKVAEFNQDDIRAYDIVLIVHEKPDRPCAERPMLIKWFNDNNYELEEYIV